MIYIHKLTREKLSIKKQIGNIAICYISNPYYIYNNVLCDTCICDISNLIPITLF